MVRRVTLDRMIDRNLESNPSWTFAQIAPVGEFVHVSARQFVTSVVLRFDSRSSQVISKILIVGRIKGCSPEKYSSLYSMDSIMNHTRTGCSAIGRDSVRQKWAL